MLLAKEELVLQGVIDGLKLANAMEWRWKIEESKLMRISRQQSPAQVMTDRKQLENVECFSYLGSVITNYSRYACEIKSRKS